MYQFCPMILKELSPRKALNKAFLKVKPNRTDIERFKANMIKLLDSTNETESEEFHKNLVIEFLKKTYYDPSFFINTKGRNDLVIHNGKDTGSSVRLIMEAKKPANKAEMMTTQKLNSKAFQELVLYYLRERFTHKNLEIRHLVATNINEWFIFDAVQFERLFARNSDFVKQFNDFEDGRLADTKTDFFYRQIAEPYISGITTEIEFTYFNLRDYQKPLRNTNREDDNLLIALFKLLSPEHLLKLRFANDSNSLDRRFYSELLHIIGLAEIKAGSKKLIERNKEGERNPGSILEDTIIQLDSLDKLSRLEKPDQYGNNKQEQLFNIAIELSITWINRILFLKLMEAQLIRYHKGDKAFSFLNPGIIRNFDDLNGLFFQVLARRQDERNEDVKKAFDKIPYLNSSLFEPTELEQVTLFISNLKGDKNIPVFHQTVLKDQHGKKRTGRISTLEYLFEFLNAYDFSSEGSEEIQEENKTLINASVLGLIFEKINGYKDGSFFTPGFITMYMCRETIRKAIVQKFNEIKKWNCTGVDELYDRIENRKEANDIVNNLKICDPAVGSGHFLVSALNEIIAVKNDLKILQDRDGKRLKEYHVEVVNDELNITDEDGNLFEYKPGNRESQRVQETLFHEKQTIIENCLFGVDINPNSVKICRLRLWIELLKNAYYKNATELETLPNIDINIKCGNSLVSRYPIDADLKPVLRKGKWSMDSYRVAVATYRNAKNKEQKRELKRLISEIKKQFSEEIVSNDPLVKRLEKVGNELYHRFTGNFLFEPEETYGKNKKDLEKKQKAEQERLEKEVKKINARIERKKSGKIYEKAIEWRFEFPEILNDDGDFVGFDVVIGNPPYVNFANLSEVEREYYSSFDLFKNKTDLYAFFVGLAGTIKNHNGFICLIIPHTWISTISFYPLRDLLLKRIYLMSIVELDFVVFKDAFVKTVIILTDNKPQVKIKLLDENFLLKTEIPKEIIFKDEELKINLTWNPVKHNIYTKIKSEATKLGDIIHFTRGIKTSNDKRFLFKEDKGKDYYKVIRGRNIKAFRINHDDEYIWYRPDLMKEKVGCLPHSKELFLASEKIITQRVNSSGQLFAAYDNDKYFCLDTTNVSSDIIDKNYNLKFIVGIINSRLINWWFNDEFKNPTISGYELHQIPIKHNKKIEIEISSLVTEIITNSKLGIDSIEQLKKIDQLVYKLYGLTKEEIKIIEGKIKSYS